MSLFYVRALRETFTSPRWLPVTLVGTLLSALVVVDRVGLWEPLAGMAMLFVIGYQISYAREVALTGTPALPGVNLLQCLRRGFGALIVMLPAGMLLIALLGIPVGSSGMSRTASQLLVMGALVLLGLLLYPSVARYAYFDKVSEGLRYSRAFRQLFAAGAVVLAPVLWWLAMWAVQRLLHYGVVAVLGPETEWLSSATAVVSGHAQLADLGVLLVTLMTSAITFNAALVQSHLTGQAAAKAFAPPLAAEVALTSASS